MPTLITINSVTSGTSPYDIWVCDTCFGTCQYVATTTTLPYSFTLPTAFETYISYIVKIVDDNNCVNCQDMSTYKQFQIGTLFDFMDGEQYKFQ